MRDIIIACENLQDEIKYFIEKLNLHYEEIIYIESQLHNNPKKLKERIQSEIDKYSYVDNIILLFGLCGNGTLGIKSENANIIMPKVDDCISLYLGGIEKRKNIQDSIATYFLTKRYVENEMSIYNEMKTMKEKYSEKKVKKIYKMLFDKYEYIRTIRTHTYKEEEIIDKVSEMCEMFDLKYENIDSDLSILEDILNKNYENEILVINKGEEITQSHFTL